MAKEEMSLVDKIRNRLNENAGKELVKTFGEEDSLLQVKSWIPLKPFFKLGTGGEGFPCGHVTTIIGKPDSGKSTLAMEGMISCQKLGGIAYLIDSEHKFSMGRFALMGGNPKDVMVIQTNTLEEAWTAYETILKEIVVLREEGVKAPMMLVWDSVAASVPEAIMESEAGDHHVGIEAKMNNKNIRRLKQLIEKTELAAVHINHYYMTQPKTKFEQSEIIIKGGEELSFLSTLILRTKQGAKITRTVLGEEQQIGRTTRFFIHKGHFHGRTITKDVSVVDIGILETTEELNEYKKGLRGEI
jgi:recombination protein RecA